MKPSAINLTEVPNKIKKLQESEGVDTYLGAMMTTRGILILLFSHRQNKDFPLLVSGTDTIKVLAKVFEALHLYSGAAS